MMGRTPYEAFGKMREMADQKPELETGFLSAPWSIQDLHKAWAGTLREAAREITPQLLEINLIQDDNHVGGQSQQPCIPPSPTMKICTLP